MKKLKNNRTCDEFAPDGAYPADIVSTVRTSRLNAEHRGQTLHDTIDIVLGELSDELLPVGPTRGQQLKTAAIAIIRIL